MSNDKHEKNLLTPSGHQRRGFLKRSALMTAGASAAAVLPAASEAAAKAKKVPAGICADPKAPMKDVAGKVAFITGGASGIGLGIAQAFVDAGMKVVIADISEKYIKEALAHFAAANQSDKVHAIRVNVTERTAMEEAAAETVEVFGKVHVLVNNAGVVIHHTLAETSYKDFNWLMDVNVNGVLNGVHAFLPLIKSHGEGGQIVATSSVLGLFVWGTMEAAYVASKFAVNGMMESLCMELADKNIGVSILCPGWVGTNLGASSRSTRPEASAQAVSPQEQAEAERKTKAAIKGAMESGLILDPFATGQMLLQGMRNNDLYVLTHPEWEQLMQYRYDVIAAGLPKGQRVVEERLSKSRSMTQASIYATALNRKSC